jgi:hypothetical protein
VNGKNMYRTNIVYAGARINAIENFKPDKLQCDLDFFSLVPLSGEFFNRQRNVFECGEYGKKQPDAESGISYARKKHQCVSEHFPPADVRSP